ncbi:MAG: ParB/RepB/Spo0J family partition protein [Proteobacteria bacterium]|nr:ParB/RepB/Spo0J family partition protein [Desulfobulbaceae bacterium]MBU4151882.1 ParB/RepB/Spo0J family partition protein [Pseudomonadota bacterium]MDP2106434.1 ParB/RepB/Spo0J family partition protein [Desulfobulbaceae bacterium]
MSKSLSPLGKGLMALLPMEDEKGNLFSSRDERGFSNEESPYFLCPIAFIQANPYQPRKSFNPEELESLSASIKEKGILQPLVVRKISANQYELIAGERRLRAAQMAEHEKVPVLIKDIAISDRLELALIENIQRENLNPIEEAEAYAQLMEEFGLTQDTVSKRVGKNRSTVANSLRILQLPDFVKESVASNRISSGHARVLLTLNSDAEVMNLHDTIITQTLSVRETEALAKRIKNPPPIKEKGPKMEGALPESYCLTLTKTLNDYFGTRTKIFQKGDSGKIEIEYATGSDLERLLALILQEG